MNIQVLKWPNSQGVSSGLYTTWLGNALSDAVANALIAEGAAVLTNIQSPSMPARYALDSSGNVTGLVGPDGGELPISSNKMTAVIFGDSMTANNYSSSASFIANSDKGYFTWANALLGQRFELLDVAGVSGNTTAQMLERIDTDVLAFNPGYVFVLGGYNDIANGVAWATTVSNLEAIYAKLISHGIKVIALAVLPSATFNTTTKQQAVSNINLAIGNYATRNQGVIFVDTYSALLDPTSAVGGEVTAYLTDTIHPSTSGAQAMGKAIYNAVNGLFPKKVIATSIADIASATNPYGNQIANPVMQGTGGTNQAGSSGQVATNWSSIVTSGTATVVCSKVARTDFPTLTWQQVDITSTSGSSVYDLYAFAEAMASSGLAVGDVVYGECEVELESIVGLSVDELKPYISATSGTGITISYANGNNNGAIKEGSFVFRTPDFTVPPSTAGLRAYNELKVTGAGTCTLRVGKWVLRKVQP